MFLKKMLTSALLFTACATVTAQRKNAMTDHNNVIKINFNTDLSDGGIPLAWELKTKPRQSLQLGLSFTYYTDGDYKKSGIGFNPEYRFYLSKNKPGISGIYAGPTIGINFLKVRDYYYNSINGTSDLVTFNTTLFNIGGVFGHQWVWSSGFALDLNIGLGLRTSSISNRPGQYNYYQDDFEGFIPRLGVAIGYAF